MAKGNRLAIKSPVPVSRPRPPLTIDTASHADLPPLPTPHLTSSASTASTPLISTPSSAGFSSEHFPPAGPSQHPNNVPPTPIINNTRRHVLPSCFTRRSGASGNIDYTEEDGDEDFEQDKSRKKRKTIQQATASAPKATTAAKKGKKNKKKDEMELLKEQIQLLQHRVNASEMVAKGTTPNFNMPDA
ncbi:SubName: Full=Uncharacterized protein {ECO:0000313/EMBL:CCA76103.1} [Serendipita indica DSM 11827]|nr:SubName: Full=Uncharacterized protein {ECO:0000313/EMBL:CCA76103.1} [Serendipita indica DSM 11827]